MTATSIRGTYWIRSWWLLFKEEEREVLKSGCMKMETTIMNLFNRLGWKLSNRIGA